MIITRVTRGAISLSSSSHFPPREYTKLVDAPARDCPVAPPGVTTARHHPFSVFRIGTLFDAAVRDAVACRIASATAALMGEDHKF